MGKRLLTFSLACLAGLLIVPHAAFAQDPTPSSTDILPGTLGTVITVHVEYRNGSWSKLTEPLIIHCRPPRLEPKPIRRARIQILDEAGNRIGHRDIDDPRLSLYEDPSEPWAPANEANLVLAIQLQGNPVVLEFIEDYELDTAPQLSIDLDPIMNEYRTIGARRLANCENADPPFRSVRGQEFFVLQYALSHAADSGSLSEEQILEKLSTQGLTAVKSMKLPPAVRKLLQETAYRPK